MQRICRLLATDSSMLPLLRFLVRRVLPAAITELLELETASGRLFVLRRRVVALLALAALQCHNFTHLFILPDFPGPPPGELFPSVSGSSSRKPAVRFSNP
jgi:hypothetical protein